MVEKNTHLIMIHAGEWESNGGLMMINMMMYISDRAGLE